MIGELGHYTVGDKVFYSKTDAMLYATQVNENIKWHFYEDKFSSVDWTKEPEISLDSFYAIRACQIRNAYDYVAVFFSGGSDSTNLIRAFLDNGLVIDELIISEPTSGMKNFNTNDKDTSVANHISEVKYAAKPAAEAIKARHPNIRITMNDMFQNMLDFKEDWAFKAVDWHHPSAMGRFSINNLTHIKKLAEQGKKIGLVYGVEKPLVICDKDSYIKCVLIDYAVNVPQQPFDIIYPNVDRVLFYWTPDLPEMLVKQAHVVAREIYKPENAHILSVMLDRRKPPLPEVEDRGRHGLYDRAIVPWIYPSIENNLFQAGKHKNLLRGDHDGWLYDLHKSEKVTQKINSDITLLINSIDKRFMADGDHAFKRHIYMWKLGHESQFKPQVQQE